MRRAKIVCTIGPASNSASRIESLVGAGMDAARLNFSHGTREEHAAVIERVRAASAKLSRPVAVLQDLEGPKIRLGRLKGGAAKVSAGDKITLTTRALLGDERIVSTSHVSLAREVSPGARILIDDGAIALEAEKIEGEDVHCRVLEGGWLRDHKGLNLPGINVAAPSLTEKDIEDLKFALSAGVDYVALSFVRRAEDIEAARTIMAAAGTRVPLIAKIEKPQAVDDLDRIIGACDGVMVARGDLGVEVPPERVPLLQKRIIAAANASGILVITATQMLESMTHAPRPTRAEASDVANAIFDGTDAVMLSAETAAGEYPVESVAMMARIVEAAETGGAELGLGEGKTGSHEERLRFSDAVADAAVVMACDVRARAIVAFTMTGATARLISKRRPNVPIVAFTPFEETERRLALFWGVVPKRMELVEETDEMIAGVRARLLAEGLAERGDVVVLVCGAPLSSHTETNMLRLLEMSERR